MDYEISTYDFFVGGLFALLLLFYGGAVQILNKDKPHFRFYLSALSIKLIGGLGFALIYIFYYNYQGDTFAYYHDIQILTEHFYQDPRAVFAVLYQEPGTFNSNTFEITQKLFFFRAADAFTVVKVGTIINIICLNSYIATTLMFSFISFLGLWKLFELFNIYYPTIKKQLVIAVFFIPSVFFWGSSILKDSIVIGSLGIILYGLQKIIIEKKLKMNLILAVIISIYFMFIIKSYVLFSLLPATVTWVFPTIKSRIKNKAIKVFIAPVIVLFTIACMAFLISYLSGLNDRFSMDNLMKTAKSYQDWHYMGEDSERAGRGSSYTLGSYDESVIGILVKVPAAINATLFRPYLWEVHNGVVLFAAIESLILTLFTIRVFFSLGLFKTFKILIKEPFILMCFIFSLFFAFAVGFTSYNFGALVRYKIPCIPIFVGMLIMLNFEVQKSKSNFQIK